MKKISIIIPCYNEQEAIPYFYKEINKISKPMKNEFEQMLKLLDYIGYNSYYKVLNSKDYGIPQSRNRIYIVSIRKDIDNKTFEFPDKQELKLKASDLYDKNVSDEFYLEEKYYKYFNEFRLKKNIVV